MRRVTPRAKRPRRRRLVLGSRGRRSAMIVLLVCVILLTLGLIIRPSACGGKPRQTVRQIERNNGSLALWAEECQANVARDPRLLEGRHQRVAQHGSADVAAGDRRHLLVAFV